MQELDQYLDWCDKQYSNSQHCQCNANCTNGNYCGGIQTNCYSCIRRVHKWNNNKIHYNCDKMALYYVLKHTYRFGAEIFFQLNRLRNYLSKWQDIYVASIGCGPCSELFGALSFWRTMGKPDNTFHFRGFDTELLWTPLMNQVKTIFQTIDVQPKASDAFAYYRIAQERVDIIVLNYMLSDMRKFNTNQYQQFLTDIIAMIRQNKPKYLLINDIYLSDSLTASNELLKMLRQSKITYRSYGGQYHIYNPSIGHWGNQIQKQPFAMSNAAIVCKYQPFPETNSIQTIIQFL